MTDKEKLIDEKLNLLVSKVDELQSGTNFSAPVAVAIAEFRTQMVSVNNHIRENKENYKEFSNKIDGWQEERAKKDQETNDRIHAVESKLKDHQNSLNVKFAFFAGIWAAVESYFKLRG